MSRFGVNWRQFLCISFTVQREKIISLCLLQLISGRCIWATNLKCALLLFKFSTVMADDWQRSLFHHCSNKFYHPLHELWDWCTNQCFFFFLPEDIVYAQAKACIFQNVIYYICIITLSRNNDFCFLKIKHHHASFKPETVHLHQKLPSHFDESLRRKGLHAILSGRATQPTT